MRSKYIDILGTRYFIELKKQNELAKITEAEKDSFVYGLCNYNDRKIYIDEEIAKIDEIYKTTLRHELVHAFLYQSGLATQCDFAQNEMLVDWIALQFPAMYQSFKKIDVL